jgi:AraC-like DNA-binding protein
MADGATLSFDDPDRYAAEFSVARVNLTITGAGDFKARMTRLKLEHLEIHRCCENLPRIAYITLSPEPIFVSFPVGAVSHIFDGFALRSGDMILHSRGDRMHQRLTGECQWGLISLSPEVLASCGEALTGRPIVSPPTSRIIRPSRAGALRFQRLLSQACRLADARKKLIDRPEVARALEQEMLHAIIHCLTSDEADDHAKARHHHAAVMARFEEMLSKRTDERLTMPALSAGIGVPERTLRMCCAEFLGESPTRYVLLQRLNRARAALRRADPSTASVAEVARNHQFLEFGRFAVTYRATFGESPSVTLQRDRRS